MRSLILLSIVFLLSIFSSCSCDDDVEPTSIADEMIGAYTGKFTFRAPDSQKTDTVQENMVLITRHNEHQSLFIVTIDGFSRVVTLRNVTKNGTEKFSGEVYVYSDASKIGEADKEIAGAGSFAYSSNNFTLLWIADPINDEWKFTFNGTRN